jgi:aldehyde:ferredoxin oxidoreductase
MVPRWSDPKTLHFLTDKILKLEGVGKLFRKGIRGAVEKIGKESAAIAVEVKGLDQPAHDPRAVFGLAVNYATSPRGACHERGNPQASALGLFFPDCGMDAPPDRFSEDEAAYSAFMYQNTSLVYNCMTFCKFMVGFAGQTISEMVKELEYATGLKYTTLEFLECGQRSMALQRLINVRDGLRRADDTLPPKMRQAAVVGGRAGKAPVNFDKMLSDYYKLRGWDSNGVPTKESLQKLGLEDYIKYLPG